jgi:hypothetical protein
MNWIDWRGRVDGDEANGLALERATLTDNVTWEQDIVMGGREGRKRA